MKDKIVELFKKINFIKSANELENLLIERDFFLNDELYYKIKADIICLKNILSSSNITVIQDNADIVQKWPLLNFVRQMLNLIGYNMIPIRKSAGYDENKKKLFKRFFLIKKK